MPDSRPLPPPRSTDHDNPPASSEASTPQTRRQRLRRAILGTNELAQDVINMANPERQGRRSTVGGLTRRRQRSSSEHDELSTSTPEGEGGRRRRSNKRRRLNTGPEAPARKAIKYGYYGQVEPGRLKLDLMSCDGGQHVDARHPETSLGPHNLLRHDKSVYCSERPQTNIILKHADDNAFCLEKLHIVGPEMGFTAPVRAGVVYVAMTMAELQQYVDPKDHDDPMVPPHARRWRYSPYRRAQRRREVESPRSSPELLSISEALRDPYINAAHSSRDRARDEEAFNYFEEEDEADAYCDSNPATDPSNWLHDTANDTFVRRTQPVTILSDEDAGPEETSAQEVLDYRSQRERMMRRRYDIENWHRTREAGISAARGGEETEYHYTPVSPRMESIRERDREREAITTLPLSRLLARQRDQNRGVPASPSSSDWDSIPALEPMTPPAQPEPAPENQRPYGPFNRARYCTLTGQPLENYRGPSGTNSNNASSSTNPNPASNNSKSEVEHNPVTIAPFRLARGKYKVAIKFDPPVSGRFIMLKLWAGNSNGEAGFDGEERYGRGRDAPNVDVQSVVAKGWMGSMRFFPALEMK